MDPDRTPSHHTEPPLVVDAIGLPCPRPIIDLARAIDAVSVGARVLLVADDPAAPVDVPVWCRMQRHRLVTRLQGEDGVWRFEVERRR